MKTLLLAFRLTLCKLRRERLAALCLCIAVAAALVPLLMVLGLKEGIVTKLRRDLLAKPANLEIRVRLAPEFTQQGVKEIRRIPLVSFCVPCISAAGEKVYLRRHDDPQTVECDLRVTGLGDPLMAEVCTHAPGENEVVLGADTAKALGVRAGDTVRVKVTRTKERKEESCEVERTVCGILKEQDDSDNLVYAPLSLSEAVIDYRRDERAALDGAEPEVKLRPVCYGFMVAEKEKVEANAKELFPEERRVSAEECGDMPEATTLFVADTPRPFISDMRSVISEMRSVKKALRGTYNTLNGALRLWNPPLVVGVRGGAAVAEQLQVCCTPVQGEYGETETGLPQKIILRSSAQELCGTQVVLELKDELRTATVAAEVQYDAAVPAGTLQAGALTLGLLHNALQRGVSWDAQRRVLRRPDRTYTNMRLYARTLESVAPLKAIMEQRGYGVDTKAATIKFVQNLNLKLGILFRLLAGIGIAGAAFSLALSLYNGVLKSRREYAILRTLGFSRTALAFFPVLESLVLTMLSLALSFGIFHLLSDPIAMLFSGVSEGGKQVAAVVEPQEHLCCLSLCLHLQIIGTGLLVALAAAVAAAVTVLRVQPSAAIRDI